MAGRIASLDFAQLEQDGYLVLPGLVQPRELARFEHDIALAGDRLAAQRRVARRSDEALADVLLAAGRHRPMLFDHVKRLLVLERLAVEVGVGLEEAGLLGRVEVPIVWPTLRADLPGEDTYVLPLHQDYATTRSRTAWRLWIPLRDVDRVHGTMEVAPGSHRAGPFSYVPCSSDDWAIPREELSGRGLGTITLELPAGHGVLFSPWLAHASVPNRSQRTKWVLLLHVQDLAAFADPDDPADPLRQFLDLTDVRTSAPARRTPA